MDEKPPSILDRIAETPVSWAIVLLNLGVFLIAETHGGTTNTATLVQFGASERGRLWSGEYWRLVSPIFLHIGWVHLLWNTMMMLPLCRSLETTLKPVRFAAAYLACGIAGVAASVLCHDAVSAGASGAGFGLIGVILAMIWRIKGREEFLRDRQVRQTLFFLALWTVLGFTVLRMDNFAHLGGLAAGAAIGAILRRPGEPIGRGRVAARAALAAAFVALVAAAAWPWPGRRAEWSAYERARAAEAAFDQGRFAEALSLWRESERYDPQEPGTRFNMGLARLRLGDLEGAEADAREAARRWPDSPNPEFLLASVARAKGDRAAAARHYREALRKAPADWKHRAEVEEALRGPGE